MFYPSPVFMICAVLLGDFAELQETTVSFVMSVCLSVCPSVEQLDFHWTHFNEILYLSIFRQLTIKLKFH